MDSLTFNQHERGDLSRREWSLCLDQSLPHLLKANPSNLPYISTGTFQGVPIKPYNGTIWHPNERFSYPCLNHHLSKKTQHNTLEAWLCRPWAQNGLSSSKAHQISQPGSRGGDKKKRLEMGIKINTGPLGVGYPYPTWMSRWKLGSMVIGSRVISPTYKSGILG